MSEAAEVMVGQTLWTGPQRAAIEHVGGDLLVSAAAGSGKTAVLAERCARLVCETAVEAGGCGVEGLLVLTFTDAAANEMRGRIAAAIREKLRHLPRGDAALARRLRRQSAMVDRASISTLHGFRARVLRQHFHEAGIDPAFEVFDEEEAGLLRDEVLGELLAKWHGERGAGGVAHHSGTEPEASPFCLGATGRRPQWPTPSQAAGFGENLPGICVAPGAGQGEGGRGGFGAFLEAYAEGRETACREMILGVHRMLSSVANPAEYADKARALYAPGGRAATVQRYFSRTLAGQVRVAAITARRAATEVQNRLGAVPMLNALRMAARGLEKAAPLLERHEVAAAREALEAIDWPKRLSGGSSDDSYKAIKERTYDQVRKLCANLGEFPDPGQMMADLARLEAPLNTLLSLVEEFRAAYAEAKRAQNRLDFADLERMTVDLLAAPGSLAAAELRGRYCHILVDEFQDVNPLQAALLETVRSAERFDGAGNLFVVGDVKQSIYAFRLAEPRLFLQREAAARAAAGGTVRYVGLPHNFRSHPGLLAAMNGIFEKLLTRDVAEIAYDEGHGLEAPPAAEGRAETAAKGGGREQGRLLAGSPVEMHLVAMKREENGEPAEGTGAEKTAEEKAGEDLPAVEEEARMVAGRIAELMTEGRTIKPKDGEERPLQYRDIAILLRSMKDKAMIFARALARRGIPVHAELSTGYFDAPEVQGTLALLQVIDNPRQDIPLATVLLGPYGRFSHDDVAAIRLTFDRKRVAFPDAVERYAMDGGQVAGTPDAGRDPPPFDADLARRLTAFLEKIGDWRILLRSRPLHEGLAEIFSQSRILAYLAGLEAGAQRAANLQALHRRALTFAGFRKQGLHRFLRFIEKLREQEGDFGEAPILSEASDVVRIMTVHKSKGLEFPVVIAAGLGGMLNLRDNGPVFVHRDLGIGLEVADVERNIIYHSAASASIVESNKRSFRAEELRLLYVALTRARDHLILTGHVDKAEKVGEIRELWKGHAGALPEDVLLKGRTFLSWILPALAGGGLRVQWPGEAWRGAGETQVRMEMHAAAGAEAGGRDEEAAVQNDVVRRILAAEPLVEAPKNAATERMIDRVTGTYAHEALAKQPAVLTVTRLKGEEDEEERGQEEAPAVKLFQTHAGAGGGAGGDEARLRGIATHRILELLDFAACGSAEAVEAAIERLIAEKRISAEDAARADAAGIAWCMAESEAGKRLRAAARRREAGEGIEIRREIAFTWLAPARQDARETGDPADWPTIRGVIDVLVVDRAAGSAEILDYKTDSAFTWEGHAGEYERQMRYYLRAAREILGFPVARATLLFLTPRRERAINLQE